MAALSTNLSLLVTPTQSPYRSVLTNLRMVDMIDITVILPHHFPIMRNLNHINRVDGPLTFSLKLLYAITCQPFKGSYNRMSCAVWIRKLCTNNVPCFRVRIWKLLLRWIWFDMEHLGRKGRKGAPFLHKGKREFSMNVKSIHSLCRYKKCFSCLCQIWWMNDIGGCVYSICDCNTLDGFQYTMSLLFLLFFHFCKDLNRLPHVANFQPIE